MHLRVLLFTVAIVLATAAATRQFDDASMRAFPTIDPDASRNFTDVVISKGSPARSQTFFFLLWRHLSAVSLQRSRIQFSYPLLC
jgi:hypothetical protein